MSPCDKMKFFSGLKKIAHGCGIVYVFGGGVVSNESVISYATYGMSHGRIPDLWAGRRHFVFFGNKKPRKKPRTSVLHTLLLLLARHARHRDRLLLAFGGGSERRDIGWVSVGPSVGCCYCVATRREGAASALERGTHTSQHGTSNTSRSFLDDVVALLCSAPLYTHCGREGVSPLLLLLLLSGGGSWKRPVQTAAAAAPDQQKFFFLFFFFQRHFSSFLSSLLRWIAPPLLYLTMDTTPPSRLTVW